MRDQIRPQQHQQDLHPLPLRLSGLPPQWAVPGLRWAGGRQGHKFIDQQVHAHPDALLKFCSGEQPVSSGVQNLLRPDSVFFLHIGVPPQLQPALHRYLPGPMVSGLRHSAVPALPLRLFHLQQQGHLSILPSPCGLPLAGSPDSPLRSSEGLLRRRQHLCQGVSRRLRGVPFCDCLHAVSAELLPDAGGSLLQVVSRQVRGQPQPVPVRALHIRLFDLRPERELSELQQRD